MLQPFLFVFADAAADGFAQRIADALNRDPIEYLLKEAGHDHANGLFARQTATARVEDLCIVDASGRRTVRAADVVGLDLQPGDRIGSRVSESIRLSLR